MGGGGGARAAALPGAATMATRRSAVQEAIPQRHAQEMVVSWSNPDYDTALLLTQVTGNVANRYARHVEEFIRGYVDADGSQIWCAHPAAAPLHQRSPQTVAALGRARSVL